MITTKELAQMLKLHKKQIHSQSPKSKFKNSKLDLKSEAKALKEEGKSIRDIARILKQKYGANAPKKSTIGEWVKG